MPKFKGEIIFAFSVEGEEYHIYYDELLAEGQECNRVVGAIYKLMQEYPELIEQVLQAALKASEELSIPFKNILNEKE